jgi:periplasmic divalent cation tolerance protein
VKPCGTSQEAIDGYEKGALIMTRQFVYMTAGSLEEARRIGELLVADRLAACVNIIDGMHSIYRWEGKLQKDRETVMIAKTTRERLPALMEAVKANHSYDCPCIVSLDIDGGHPEFLEWISTEASSGHSAPD